MAQPSIIADKLTKRYAGASSDALKDLSFSIAPGEIYGFLGPNGAGKSTTIRTFLNFIQPTSGTAIILGHDSREYTSEVRRRIGYLAGDAAYYPNFTGRQFLDYMQELSPAASHAYVRELCRRFKAELDKKMADLSRGNRQKIGIIQAFMHQPDIVILDEPSSGLDPLMQEEFYTLLDESRQRGAAVFMSSHIMGEVQRVCDRVGIIRDGQKIREVSIADLLSQAAQTFEISFGGTIPLDNLHHAPSITIQHHSKQSVTLHVRGSLQPLLQILSRSQVTRLESKQLDLEAMFIGYYQDHSEKQA